MLKKIKYLILIILIVFLTIPQTAQAGLPVIDEIISGIDAALGGVEEAAAPLIKAFIEFFLVFVAGFLALEVSATLFVLVVEKPNWISLSSGMVESGWHFTAGLANMFLILFLIFIAICFILKIETFATKKTLISLIIVALLLNFSLLFVKMIVDLPIFAFNTLETAAGGNFSGLISQVISPLIISMALIIPVWALTIIGLGVSFITPFAPLFQLGFIFAFPALIPILAVLAFFVWAAFLLAGIFFTYVFLFGARGVILALFAILAPLAFLSLIFPQTKKYWDKWLKIVIEWAFLGVALLFLLVLGFKGLKFLTPEYAEQNPYGGGIFGPIKVWFVYYLFLFIYLLFVALVSRKLMPTFAEGLISGAKQAGGIIWSTGIKPIATAAGREAGRAAVALREREEDAKKDAAEQRLPYKPSFGMRLGKGLTTPVRWAYRLRGITPEREVSKEIEEKAAELEKRFGKDTKSAMVGGLPLGWKATDPSLKSAMALYLSKMYGADDKGQGRLSKAQLNEAINLTKTYAPHRVEDIVKHRQDLIDDEAARKEDYKEARARNDQARLMAMSEYDRAKRAGRTDVMKGLEPLGVGERERTAKLIQHTMVSKGIGDKDVQIMIDRGIEIEGETIEELIKTDLGKIKAIRAATFKKAIDALKREDVDTLARETLENANFMEGVARWKPWSFIRTLGEEKGLVYVDKLQDAAEKITIREIAKTNPNFVRTPYTPGGLLMTRPWENIPNKREADNLIRSVMGRPPAAPPPAAPPPTPPPEVPPQWIPGPRGTWVPPSGYVPPTHTRAERNAMAEEVNKMTRELNRLRKLPVKSDEDEEAIKMIEAAMRDIRQRLGK